MRLLPLLLALAVAGTSIPPAEAGLGDPPRVAQADRQAERKKAKLKKRLRAMRAVILIDELELDEDTAARLLPILGRYDDELARLAREAIDLRARIDGAADDELDDLVDDLVANQRSRWDLDEKRFAEVRKVLTRRQAARILVVLPEIDRKILEGARKALRAPAKKAGKKARGKKAPADDELKNPF